MGGGDSRSANPAAPSPVLAEWSTRRLGPVRRFLVRRPVVADAGVVLTFTGWALLIGLGADSMYLLHRYLGGEQVLQMQYASLALTVAGAAALPWRRRRPLLVAVVMSVLGVVTLATTGATSGFELGVAFALYAVAASERPLLTWATSAGSVAALLVAAQSFALPATVGALTLGVDPDDAVAFAAVTQRGAGGFLLSSAWYQTVAPVLVLGLLAVAVGTSVRNRRLRDAAFVEALAREQEQRARLAQVAERTRIAGEMHDVVAHSVSVMVALGGGAAAALDWAPERSRTALDELVATGRSALADIRRLLGVLHEDEAPLEPQPGSLDLAALVERSRVAGLPVRATGVTGGALQDLDASLQLAVYRIVQESLTNALRHAPGTGEVELRLQRHTDAVEVVVTDQGADVPVDVHPGSFAAAPGRAGSGDARPAVGSGRGLVGMTERAAVFGGTVEAGPYGGGWRVRALLPWREGEV